MEGRPKILMIEDEEKSAELMKIYLEDCGFEVDNAFNITDALSYASAKRYDLALLDMRLPDYSGMEFLRGIKNRLLLPVIVVSAHGDTAGKVRAFKYGASDYMVKPVDMEELEARIWVVLGRNGQIGLGEKVSETEKIFEIVGKDILFRGERVELTQSEFEILSILVGNRGATVSRERIIDSLHNSCSLRSLDNHIKNIRRKLAKMGNDERQYIKTVYAQGYLLDF